MQKLINMFSTIQCKTIQKSHGNLWKKLGRWIFSKTNDVIIKAKWRHDKKLQCIKPMASEKL